LRVSPVRLPEIGEPPLYLIVVTLLSIFVLANFYVLAQTVQLIGIFALISVYQLSLTLDKTNESHTIEQIAESKPKRNFLFNENAASPQCKVLLLLTVLLGLILRYYDIDGLDSYRDEEHHIYKAFSLIGNGESVYNRAHFLSYTTAVFAKIFGAQGFYEYLHAGRVNSVLISSLVAVPIFVLGKYINQYTGLIAAFLWSISPWSISVSRLIREYAVYPFIILFACILLVELYRQLKLGKSSKKKIITYIILLLLINLYAVFVDRYSTLKLIVLIEGTLFAVSLALIFMLDNNWKLLFGALGITLVGLAICYFSPLYNVLNYFIEVQELVNPRWAETIFLPSANLPWQWWYTENIGSYYLVYGLFTIGIIAALKRREYFYFIPLAIVLVYTFLFLYVVNRYYTALYMYYLLPFLCIIVAMSIYYIVDLSLSLKPKALGLIALVVAMGLTSYLFRPYNTYQTTVDPVFLANNKLASSGCVHNDKSDLKGEIEKYTEGKDLTRYAFITSIYEYLLKMEYDAKNVHRYLPSNKNKFILCKSIVARNPEGIIILDAARNKSIGSGFPSELNEPFLFEGAVVELVYDQKGSQLYRWNRPLEPQHSN